MTEEQLEKKQRIDFAVFLVLGIIGAVMTISYAIYMFNTPEASTFEQGAFKVNVKKSLPIALCLVMAQFIALAIAIETGTFNILATGIAYAVIFAIGAIIVAVKTSTGDPSFFMVLILIAILAIVIALVSLFLVLPMYVFAWLYNSIPSTLISAPLYFGIAVAFFTYAFAALFSYLWVVFVILALLVIIAICLFREEGEGLTIDVNVSTSSGGDSDYYCTGYRYDYWECEVRKVGDHEECTLEYTVYFEYKNSAGAVRQSDLHRAIGNVNCNWNYKSVIEDDIERNCSSYLKKY